MILDFYFRRPVFWDYLLAIGSIGILVLLIYKGKMSLPDAQDSFSLTGDLLNISLTLVGFILTILTVFITFKNSSMKELTKEKESVFSKFFSTEYYFESVRHLKNCIKSLVFVAVAGFMFKIFLADIKRTYLFFFNVFGLVIIMLTIYRCLLILGRILELQKSK